MTISVVLLRFVESFSGTLMKFQAQNSFSMPAESPLALVVGVFLEILSIGFRSGSLGFRLLANVSAGHVLADIANCARYGPVKGFIGIFLSSSIQFLILSYEIAVSTIQFGVFTALATVYIGI